MKNSVAAGVLVAAFYALPASAVPVLCENILLNHMYVDSQYVSSCVDGGTGNINGNPATDDFLLANPGLNYTGIGATAFTQTGSTGTFSFDPSIWNTWSSLAIGFKFGTGNQPDEWFVYLLNQFTSAGNWQFVNVFGTGGGLSHTELYGAHRTQVPEPGTLALLGAGIMGLAFVRRIKKQKSAA